jgi:alpha-ribazole phosphatase
MTGKTRIYLIRHGEVEGAGTPRYNGHADVALSERGISQYHGLSQRLSGFNITACYSSDLSRCVTGANIICEQFGIKPVLKRELRELNIGIWEGMTWAEIIENYPREWHARLADLVNYRVPEGENLLDLAGRALPAVREIIARHGGEEVLIVGHGGMNRTVLLDAIGAPLSSLFNIEQSYACLNIIDFFEDGKRTVSLLNG